MTPARHPRPQRTTGRAALHRAERPAVAADRAGRPDPRAPAAGAGHRAAGHRRAVRRLHPRRDRARAADRQPGRRPGPATHADPVTDPVTSPRSLGMAVATDVVQFGVVMALGGVARALQSGPLEAWYVDTVRAADPDADVRRMASRGRGRPRPPHSRSAPSSAACCRASSTGPARGRPPDPAVGPVPRGGRAPGARPGRRAAPHDRPAECRIAPRAPDRPRRSVDGRKRPPPRGRRSDDPARARARPPPSDLPCPEPRDRGAGAVRDRCSAARSRPAAPTACSSRSPSSGPRSDPRARRGRPRSSAPDRAPRPWSRR